jgi:protein SCO1/2
VSDDQPNVAGRDEGGFETTTDSLPAAPTDTQIATQRAALPPEQRAAALRAGSAPVPRKFVLAIIIGFAVLGLGGVLGEHLLGNTGLGVAPVTTTTVLRAPASAQLPSGPQVAGSLMSFIGLSALPRTKAPAIDLQSPAGVNWSWSPVRGQIVVLTFFNADCNDICPVISDELKDADRILGRPATRVRFVVVNTDPLETSLQPTPQALSPSALGSIDNVTFLNGPLSHLASVWSSFGVTVSVQNATRIVVHNDVMYFIDSQGRLRARATPFANESPLGLYSLDASDTARYGRGIATAITTIESGTR